MRIKIWNSLTGRKEVLRTAVPGILNWYACGPTVYDEAHLGHARNYLTQDIIRRILERHGGYGDGNGPLRVRLQMGITDIDEKIVKRAARESMSVVELGRKYEASFLDTMRRLGVRSPDRYSRVTDNIEGIIEFVQGLLDKGIGYRGGASGSIYFSIQSYLNKGFQYPKFHQCTGHAFSDAIIDEEGLGDKRSPRDFALWKAVPDTMTDSSWAAFGGRGRPGWHIECSAMIHRGLRTIDLHSGGIDLRFPHHENEIAQSEAFYGRSPWCPQFIHVGHVKYGGEKMSKSLHNQVTVNQFLEKNDPDLLRMICLLKPYRESFEFSEALLSIAHASLHRLKAFISNCELWVRRASVTDFPSEFSETDLQLEVHFGTCREAITAALIDDFDTPKCLRLLADLMERTEASVRTNQVHPILPEKIGQFTSDFLQQLGINTATSSLDSVAPLLDELVAFRQEVRREALALNSTRLLGLCDSLRDRLGSQVAIKDRPESSEWTFR